MRPLSQPTTRLAHRTWALAIIAVLGSSQAFADIVGRLKFSVLNAADERPIKGSKITLTDPTGQKPTLNLETDAEGHVTTPPIEARTWKLVVEATDFQSEKKDVVVVQDQTTAVEVLLEPVKEEVIKVKGDRILVSPGVTSTQSKRDTSFTDKFPVTAGNPQNFGNMFKTVPGFASNSLNQIHPRGEHASTTVYINGFQLPGAFQGRGGQFLSGTTVQSVDVLTGGYAPEYGSETAAILNVNLKSGTLEPFTAIDLQAGGYKTAFGNLTFGGQSGRATVDGGPKPFSYMVDLTHRTTDNALEPPDPDTQDLHNSGRTTTALGKFDFTASKRDEVSFLVGGAPSTTEVANTRALEAARQDIKQDDKYNFGVLSWRRNVSDSVSTLLSFGLIHTGLDVTNKNPGVNLNNLPQSSTIDFSPTVSRNSRNVQFQGAVSFSHEKHDSKIGFVYDKQSGSESYQLVPNSLDALQQLVDVDPRFAPVNGQASTLFADRDGYYYAVYAQDTWKPTDKFSVNYGVRYDGYHQRQTAHQNNLPSTEQDETDSGFSPRVNLAYALNPKNVIRATYNRLFTQPPIAQGSVVGNPIKPQKTNMVEVSWESQIARGQTFKVSAYNKHLTNALDTGLLVGSTQIGLYSSLNFDSGNVRGTEVSYSIDNANGFSAYLSWANAKTANEGKSNTGEDADPYADHDQLNTVSAGVSYAFHDGSVVGADLNYGSGLFSSFDGNSRTPRTQVDFRYATKPNLFGNVGLVFAVENVFDERANIAIDSAFSGTRFAQGRRIMLGLTGKF